MFCTSSLIGADGVALSEREGMGHARPGGSFVVIQPTLGRGKRPSLENRIKGRVGLPEPACKGRRKVHPAGSDTPLTQVFLR